MNQNYDPNFCYNPIYSGFDQYQPPQFPVIHHPPQATDTEMLQARENLMETIQAFLKEYDHIPPEEKCMALLLAEERFLKIKQAVEEEQNQPEVMQELLLKLMKDLQILNGIQPKQEKQAEQEEPAAQSFLLNWNFPMADDDEYTIIYRKPKAITPDLPAEEPDNSLSMGDEHLNTIPETEKSSVENLVPIPSEFKGISEDICDVPSCDNDHFDAEFGLINSLLRNTPVFDQGPCYNQDFGFNQPLHYSPSQPQQFPCENCGVLHENFQCQPMNQNYDPNFCYNPIYSGFDQYQPPQFPVIHQPPQATDTEMLQARENLMETIQAFLKEYDHIPPEEKCMALLLAEERFLKIKQAVEEEQNQPEFMQELLLKLMKDLQILNGIQPKQEK
ncbi:hypothetical protein Tco_0711103 [Tanacetum coccineum]